MNKPLSHEDFCRLVMSKLVFFRISSMLETGLILKWYQNHLPKERKCNNVFFSIGHVKANLERTKGPFVVLFIGLAVAFIIVMLELLLGKIGRK